MKHYFLFFFIIFTSPLFAQKDSSSKFQLGLSIIPEMNFRKSKIITGSGGAVAKPGITFGANASYYFTSRFSLEAGLNYAFRNYQINDNSYPEIIPNNPALPQAVKFYENFQYLEIPLTANFFSEHKKIRLITSLGISTNIFLNLKDREEWIYLDRIEEKYPNYNNYLEFNNRFSFSPILACGLDYKISDKVNLRVQPTARFAIQDKNSALSVFSAGINFGVYYNL